MIEYVKQNKKAKELAKYSIHVPVDDMQISEDLQLVVGHLMMQWLYSKRELVKDKKK